MFLELVNLSATTDPVHSIIVLLDWLPLATRILGRSIIDQTVVMPCANGHQGKEFISVLFNEFDLCCGCLLQYGGIL